jgi:hypothetical protein
MNGLRVYVDFKRPDPWWGGAIFYTRRAGGPFYRWRYEELVDRWLGSRMNVCDLTLSELVSAPWKRIPAALKKTLDEHYVD